MINEVIQIRKDNPAITLTTYVSTDLAGVKPRKAVLIFPGGGYNHLAHHEGEKIALNFLSAGINAFVLKYSSRLITPDMAYPKPQVDASNAMKYIKDNAERYNIDPNYVFVLGFSAGGHLASSMGTIWHKDEIYADSEPMEYGYNKPAGMILCYPVTTAKYHAGSLGNLYGHIPTQEEYDAVDSVLNVDERTCPAFFWHTSDDSCVPVESSLLMAKAMKEHGIKFEMHVYPEGRHGLGIPDGNGTEDNYPNIATWIKHAIYWGNNF